MSFRVRAIMCVYNEADILTYTLRHLFQQGIEVSIIDNWSTDGSDTIAGSFPLSSYERFPARGPSKYYSWAPMLERAERIAKTSGADWCMLYDADEIRRSNREETLLEGFQRVDQKYSAIDFKTYVFLPVDDSYSGDPEKHFQYYYSSHPDCHLPQVKAWKNSGQRVTLSDTGGHYAGFDGIRVSPEKFILKHYPLRTSSQARRKVLIERMGRYDPVERRVRRWHVQYDDLAAKQNWIRNPEELTFWNQ